MYCACLCIKLKNELYLLSLSDIIITLQNIFINETQTGNIFSDHIYTALANVTKMMTWLFLIQYLALILSHSLPISSSKWNKHNTCSIKLNSIFLLFCSPRFGGQKSNKDVQGVANVCAMYQCTCDIFCLLPSKLASLWWQKIISLPQISDVLFCAKTANLVPTKNLYW